jgi:hypothetical protein
LNSLPTDALGACVQKHGGWDPSGSTASKSLYMPTARVNEDAARYCLTFTYRRDTFWQWRMVVIDYAE